MKIAQLVHNALSLPYKDYRIRAALSIIRYDRSCETEVTCNLA